MAGLVPELQRSWRLPHVASALAAVVLPSGSVVVMAGAATNSREIVVSSDFESLVILMYLALEERKLERSWLLVLERKSSVYTPRFLVSHPAADASVL